MNAKTSLLALSFLVVILASGCTGTDPQLPPDSGGTCLAPKKMIGPICCYDENANNVCDIEEAACPKSCDDDNTCTNDSCSADTDFKCAHAVNAPCCGNGLCESNEDSANVCPDDCTVVAMTDFKFKGLPDYMDNQKFVFIHTGSAESEQRVFYINFSAGSDGMENIRYTFKCNSTQHKALDSINSVTYNMSEEDDMKINKLEDEYYMIYTNFFRPASSTYARELAELEGDEKASFHFSIQKKDPQKRDELSCLVKFYFLQPRKSIDKWLYISYI